MIEPRLISIGDTMDNTSEEIKPIGIREYTCKGRCRKTLLAFCDNCDKLQRHLAHDWNHEKRVINCQYGLQCRVCRVMRDEVNK